MKKGSTFLEFGGVPVSVGGEFEQYDYLESDMENCVEFEAVSETDFDHFDEVSDAKTLIEAALETLSERERKVIYMRFGIGCRTDHTLEETGFAFEVTRERIRQIESKVIRKMRSYLLRMPKMTHESFHYSEKGSPQRLLSDSEYRRTRVQHNMFLSCYGLDEKLYA